VLKAGDAHAKKPSTDTPCVCHYTGTLTDGREFDSSYARGSPATFTPGDVIKGWCEAMQLMREGDRWLLFVPSELAYGDASR
jgi:FKBP-type peptidyl-prolyl cis-trans isomerase FklB